VRRPPNEKQQIMASVTATTNPFDAQYTGSTRPFMQNLFGRICLIYRPAKTLSYFKQERIVTLLIRIAVG
jgi:hypothetical protein